MCSNPLIDDDAYHAVWRGRVHIRAQSPRFRIAGLQIPLAAEAAARV